MPVGVEIKGAPFDGDGVVAAAWVGFAVQGDGAVEAAFADVAPGADEVEDYVDFNHGHCVVGASSEPLDAGRQLSGPFCPRDIEASGIGILKKWYCLTISAYALSRMEAEWQQPGEASIGWWVYWICRLDSVHVD